MRPANIGKEVDLMNDRRDEQNKDQLGTLIRRTYSPPMNLQAPADLAVRVRRMAEKQPRPSFLEWIQIWIYRPVVWAPAAGLAVLVILAISLEIQHKQAQPGGPGAMVQSGAASPTAAKDPLGADFFKYDARDDEPVDVELAEGWNAVKIDDPENRSALVYFYPAEESRPAGDLPR
jgi:hypothetical protein